MFNILKKIKHKLHLLQNIYLKNKYFISRKSYSMDKEDLNIINYFKDKKNGFYIDVGCFHPLDRNNTYLLYKKNWRGINIDVSKFSIDLFNFLRPEDINVNVAISNKNSKIKVYYQKELSQLTTTVKDHADKFFQGTGRRKRSIARVRISLGDNKLFMVDGVSIEEKFPIEDHRRMVMEPLVVTGMLGRVNVNVHVIGGGFSGQAGAVRHGLSRALLSFDPDFRSALKAAGFLTRDSREKERKKYGLFRARKKQQYSKR